MFTPQDSTADFLWSHKNTAVQDGHSIVGSTGSEGRGLGNISRFDRCIFSSKNTRQQQEISVVWDTGESVPVQGFSNGSIAITEVFTMVGKPLRIYLQQRGVHIRQYLDDWQISSGREDLTVAHTQLVVQVAQ